MIKINDASLLSQGVLITRPIEKCAYLNREIARLGGHPYLFPTLALKETADKKSRDEKINLLDKMDIAIFISSTAVHMAYPFINQRWPTLPRHLVLAAIGTATKTALEKQQWPVLIFPTEHFNSETLLEHAALQKVAHKNIMIFSGNEGRQLLNETLTTRGAKVYIAEVYERYCPPLNIAALLDDWKNKQIQIVLSTSNESYQNLYRALPLRGMAYLNQTPLLVISNRMADFVQKLGYPGLPIIAKNASDQEIINALIQWSRRKL